MSAGVMDRAAGCPLCSPDVAGALWRDERCRVVLAQEPDYPAFCRVIWREHVREMSDLAPADRAHLLAVVLAVEQALREQVNPDKVNLASLGNQVPHLHWHVIARFADDAHFPDPVWAARRRSGVRHALDGAALAARLDEILSR